MLRTTATILAAVFAVAASAEGFMPWTDVFAKADVDADGSLSMQEVMEHKLGEDFAGFQPWMSDHFAALDTDGSGTVSKAELEAGMHGMNMTDDALSQAFFKQQGFMPKNSQ